MRARAGWYAASDELDAALNQAGSRPLVSTLGPSDPAPAQAHVRHGVPAAIAHAGDKAHLHR